MFIDRFIAYIKGEKRYAENTITAYGRDISHFINYLGVEPSDFDPKLITPDDIRGWIVSASESGLSPSSVNRMSSSLRAMFRYARKQGEAAKDPFKGIGYQKTPQKLPSYVPESKIDDMLAEPAQELRDDYIANRNYLITLLFYSTGIRLAELKEVKIGDFSDDMRALKVTGKGGEQRVVPIVDFTTRKIKEFTQRFSSPKICFSPQSCLFLTLKSEPISRIEIYRVVKAGLAAAGVQGKRSPHVLRHTFATHLMNNGADIREIQELLGHSSLASTQVYTHNSIAKLQQIYQSAHPRGRGGGGRGWRMKSDIEQTDQT